MGGVSSTLRLLYLGAFDLMKSIFIPKPEIRSFQKMSNCGLEMKTLESCQAQFSWKHVQTAEQS
jgi:hypothetical protein